MAQAIAWCAPHVDVDRPRDCLRCSDFRPGVFDMDRATTVNALLQRRQDCVSLELAPAATPGDLLNGRLLVYFPDEDLADGAAEEATAGFFDSNNTPPWDTWVGLFRDPHKGVSSAEYLVSWVPEPFVLLASRGIDVNPEGCIVWLSHSETTVAEVLRQQGAFAGSVPGLERGTLSAGRPASGDSKA